MMHPLLENMYKYSANNWKKNKDASTKAIYYMNHIPSLIYEYY